MKKIFLIGLAAAALLTGCNQDETLEMAKKDGAISFVPYAGKSTRTLIIDGVGNLSNFYVYGWKTKDGQDFNIFDNQEVTRIGSAPDFEWTYNPLQYWEESYVYQFEAIYPKPDGTNLAFNKAKEGSEISFKNDGTQDLIYARPNEVTASATNNVKVNLSFKHLLSRVRFRITNEFAMNSSIKVKVKKIELRGCGIDGTISPTIDGTGKVTGTWTVNTTNTQDIVIDRMKSSNNGLTEGDLMSQYLIPVNDGSDNFNNRIESEAKFVFPGLGGDRKVYIEYEIVQYDNNGSETTTTPYSKEIEFNQLGSGLLMSNAYAINIKIGSGSTALNPIEFSASVEPWTPNDQNWNLE